MKIVFRAIQSTQFALKTSFVLLFLGLVFISLLSAQTPVGTIRGKVKDHDSDASLGGAKVMLTTTNPVIGAIADENGDFALRNVPVGRHILKVTYIGYGDYLSGSLNLTSGKELILNIVLTEKFLEAETVTITSETPKDQPNNTLSTVSARSFSVEETRRYAAALDDPGRMASNFAGVTVGGDGRNEIVVRGNSPIGLLWRLEGVDIPNPNHFANPGSSGGGLSLLSYNLLANSDFMTGAFAAEYGNATSGVFDLKLRKGNDEKYEFQGGFSFLGLSAAAEGPFSTKGKKGSFLVNYRYSTLGLFNLLGLPVVQGGLYTYQDVAFNLDFPTQKAGTFGLWGFGGMSEELKPAETDTAKWVVQSDRREERYRSDMAAAGLSHKILLKNNKTWIRTVLSASLTRNSFTEDTLNFNFDRFRTETQSFIRGRYILSTVVNHKFNVRHLVRTGVYFSQFFYKLNSEDYNFDLAQNTVFMKVDGNSFLIQPFFHWNWRITEKLSLNAGVHGMFLTLNNTWSAEPRFGLRWQFLPKHSLGLGYGLHSQVLPLGTYFYELTLQDGKVIKPNHELDFVRSHQAVLSYDYLIFPDLRIKAETYYQHLFNVPVGTAARPYVSTLNTDWAFETDSLLNKGIGRNYGFELTFEKFFKKNYYFILTGSYYDSQYHGIDNVWRNTRYNGNFAFNVNGGKEFVLGKKKNHVLEASARVTVLGGRRYNPIDLDASRLAGVTVYDMSQPFERQQKPYFRTDLRIAWHINRPKVSHVLSFDSQNLFNTKNDFIQRDDAAEGKIQQYYQAGFVPIFRSGAKGSRGGFLCGGEFVNWGEGNWKCISIFIKLFANHKKWQRH